MILSWECMPCIIKSYLRLVQAGALPEESVEPGMRRLLALLAAVDYRIPPPVFGREMHRMIRSLATEPDPYRSVKENANRSMMALYPTFQEMVNEADDPFDAALRLAIAGNVIDSGPDHHMDITETIDRIVNASLAIDDSLLLKSDIREAETVLFIGDNCGEIVLDKLLIATLHHPGVFYAVRGGPVLNDATLADASFVRMEETARVLTTGDDAPGVVLEAASDEFLRVFNRADVIISKGQGNLEGLIDMPQNIYFLLVTKCDVIAKRLGVGVGDFIAFKGNGSGGVSKDADLHQDVRNGENRT
jgi:uncharacterized protein with ATP-grasp and redox domains